MAIKALRIEIAASYFQGTGVNIKDIMGDGWQIVGLVFLGFFFLV